MNATRPIASQHLNPSPWDTRAAFRPPRFVLPARTPEASMAARVAFADDAVRAGTPDAAEAALAECTERAHTWLEHFGMDPDEHDRAADTSPPTHRSTPLMATPRQRAKSLLASLLLIAAITLAADIPIVFSVMVVVAAIGLVAVVFSLNRRHGGTSVVECLLSRHCPECGFYVHDSAAPLGRVIGPRACPECGCAWPLVPPPMYPKH